MYRIVTADAPLLSCVAAQWHRAEWRRHSLLRGRSVGGYHVLDGHFSELPDYAQ
jgi:hypothetical protein